MKKPNMQDIEKEIEKILADYALLLDGFEGINQSQAVSQLFTLLTKARREDLEEVKERIPKEIKKSWNPFKNPHKFYKNGWNDYRRVFLAYLDSKIEELE